jgi:MOSC domain-containing protein YiiM
MKLLSVNVGLPREIFHEGRMIRTGIYKTPVEGPVRVSALNIDGDQQADLTVHGGPSKAVYVYPSDTMLFGAKNCRRSNFRGAALAKTSAPKACSKRSSTSVTVSALAASS